MIKKLLIVLFACNSFIQAADVPTLQKKFFDEVTSLHTYKRYFKKYLAQRCNSDDIACQKKYVNVLKTWESTARNKKLQFSLWFLKNKTKISKEYFSKLEIATLEKLQNKSLKEKEFISIVDLETQLYIVALYEKRLHKLRLIGADLISSGNMEREIEIRKGDDHYFKTPDGIFSIKGGWRSDGKYNSDNTIQGYGEKGRFIYYLGKQSTLRYNVFDNNGSKIYDKEKWKLLKDDLNFALHSHKSTKRMGKPYSHGCVRMTNEMNYFLDNTAVLHKNFFKNGKWELKYSKEPESQNYRNYAGEYLVIFDKI
jgi:lipoprotein-anchoring transpeptidase ErfK/SrfK